MKDKNFRRAKLTRCITKHMESDYKTLSDVGNEISFQLAMGER